MPLARAYFRYWRAEAEREVRSRDVEEKTFTEAEEARVEAAKNRAGKGRDGEGINSESGGETGRAMGADVSKQGWGSCLMQDSADGKRRCVVEYTSGSRSEAKNQYELDAGKLECRKLMKALNKVRHYLDGVFFVMKTDARTLVAQLNRSEADVPHALVNRGGT